MMTEQENREALDLYLKKIDDVIANGYYKDDWNSLKDYPVPQWYQNAKFGIFIHWGIYSVPAWGGEWYPHFMYRENFVRYNGINYFDYHVKNWGKHKDFDYVDFIPMFKAEKFDANEWADLFKKAGAKFVMPVAEHHDGFQMYGSVLSDWSTVNMGPKRDVIAELKDAIEDKDMVFTTSSHRAEHYWFMGNARKCETKFPEYIPYGHMLWPSEEKPETTNGDVYITLKEGVGELFLQDWLARTCEIVDRFQPKIVYFDGWIDIEPMKPYLKKFAAYYYNRAKEWGIDVTINYKRDAFMHTTAVKDIERGQLADVSPRFWQNDTSVAKHSWCYSKNAEFKEPFEIVCDLVDVVSKNGSLLLNIGPRADGTIPDEDRHILEEIGKWLEVNGEGIYNTTHWRKYGEGPVVTEEGEITDTMRKAYTTEDFRFTFKDNNLYVFAMNWPEDGVVRIKTLGKKSKLFNAVIEDVSVLGADNCKFKLCDDYLTVTADSINTEYPVCIKVVTD